MIFAILLLSALFTIGECETYVGRSEGSFERPKSAAQVHLEEGDEMNVGSMGSLERPKSAAQVHLEEEKAVALHRGGYSEPTKDCYSFNQNCNGCRKYLQSCCSDKNCASGRKCTAGIWSYSCVAELKEGEEMNVGSMGSLERPKLAAQVRLEEGEEDAVGKKYFTGPICVPRGTSGGTSCSGSNCLKCMFGFYTGLRRNYCCSKDESAVGSRLCKCSRTICKANGVDSGHCDMGKNGRAGGCDQCKRGYRTSILGADWCCSASDAVTYLDCKCPLSKTCVPGGVDSGSCDTRKNGRTGGCDKCKRGHRKPWWTDYCCTSADVNKYTDCKCSQTEAEMAIAVAEPHNTVPVIVYGLSFMGLGAVLYGAGKYYCGKKDDMVELM